MKKLFVVNVVLFCVWTAVSGGYVAITDSRYWEVPYFWFPVGIGFFLVALGTIAVMKKNAPILFMIAATAVLVGLWLSADFRASWLHREELLSFETAAKAILAAAYAVIAFASFECAVTTKRETTLSP